MLNQLLKQKAVHKVIYATATLALLSSMLSWYFGIRSTSDLKAYVGMPLECHPVWQDLALHRIREGQPVDDAIAATKPVYVVRHGRFVELSYQEPFSFTAIHVIAFDGKLARACAGSCTWDYTFFNSLTARDDLEMSNSFNTNERTRVYNGQAIVHLPEAEKRGVTMP